MIFYLCSSPQSVDSFMGSDTTLNTHILLLCNMSLKSYENWLRKNHKARRNRHTYVWETMQAYFMTYLILFIFAGKEALSVSLHLHQGFYVPSFCQLFLSSDLRTVQISLPFPQRRNCFSGWLTHVDNIKSTGQKKIWWKNADSTPQPPPPAFPSGLLL